jgi:hypothetical protein
MFSHFNAAIAKIPVAPIEGGSFRFGHGADRSSQIDVDCNATPSIMRGVSGGSERR